MSDFKDSNLIRLTKTFIKGNKTGDENATQSNLGLALEQCQSQPITGETGNYRLAGEGWGFDLGDLRERGSFTHLFQGDHHVSQKHQLSDYSRAYKVLTLPLKLTGLSSISSWTYRWEGHRNDKRRWSTSWIRNLVHRVGSCLLFTEVYPIGSTLIWWENPEYSLNISWHSYARTRLWHGFRFCAYVAPFHYSHVQGRASHLRASCFIHVAQPCTWAHKLCLSGDESVPLHEFTGFYFRPRIILLSLAQKFYGFWLGLFILMILVGFALFILHVSLWDEPTIST